MRRLLVIVTTVLILGAINVSIYQKEQLLAEGAILLLELAPVDPRSLMQGDYMALRYKIAEDLHSQLSTIPGHDGYLVLQRDPNQVANFKAIYDNQRPLATDELLLHFRKRHGDIYLGAESFFFQEGQAEEYESAHYGELRVTAAGESILVGLRDEKFKLLGK